MPDTIDCPACAMGVCSAHQPAIDAETLLATARHLESLDATDCLKNYIVVVGALSLGGARMRRAATRLEELQETNRRLVTQNRVLEEELAQARLSLARVKE